MGVQGMGQPSSTGMSQGGMFGQPPQGGFQPPQNMGSGAFNLSLPQDLSRFGVSNDQTTTQPVPFPQPFGGQTPSPGFMGGPLQYGTPQASGLPPGFMGGPGRWTGGPGGMPQRPSMGNFSAGNAMGIV